MFWIRPFVKVIKRFNLSVVENLARQEPKDQLIKIILSRVMNPAARMKFIGVSQYFLEGEDPVLTVSLPQVRESTLGRTEMRVGFRTASSPFSPLEFDQVATPIQLRESLTVVVPGRSSALYLLMTVLW